MKAPLQTCQAVFSNQWMRSTATFLGSGGTRMQASAETFFLAQRLQEAHAPAVTVYCFGRAKTASPVTIDSLPTE